MQQAPSAESAQKTRQACIFFPEILQNHTSVKHGNAYNERRVQKASKNQDKLGIFSGVLEKLVC